MHESKPVPEKDQRHSCLSGGYPAVSFQQQDAQVWSPNVQSRALVKKLASLVYLISNAMVINQKYTC